MATVIPSVDPLETPPYHAVPPAPCRTNDHAITTHMPGWEFVLKFLDNKAAFFERCVDMYPRFLLHRDIKKVPNVVTTSHEAYVLTSSI